jgi:hypothetical protein
MPQGPVPRPPSQPLRYAGVPAAPNAPGLAAGRSAERGFTRPTTNVVMLGRRVLDLEGIDDKVSRDAIARKSRARQLWLPKPPVVMVNFIKLADLGREYGLLEAEPGDKPAIAARILEDQVAIHNLGDLPLQEEISVNLDPAGYVKPNSKHLGTKVRRMIASYPLLPDANPVFCRELGEFRSITYGDDPESESINLNVTMGYALDGAQRPGLQFIRSEVALGVTARLGPLEPLSFAIPAEAVPHFTTAT